jgi:hypothetical protein
MSRKSAQWLCDNDMHKIKDLKAQEAKIATRFEHFAAKWNRLTSAQMRQN